MKLLKHISPLSTQATARGVYLSQNLEGGAEAQGSIEQLLSRPMSFSLADVKRLERAVEAQGGKLEGPEQRLFATLVNAHLARLQQKKGSAAGQSRTLLGLFRQPELSQFLSSTQRQDIETLLGAERREIEKLSNTDIKQWEDNPTEIVRLARSYRFVRSRLNTSNLSVDPTLRDAGDKLKIYAAELVKKRDRTTLDNLLLVELSQIFPDRTDWKDGEVYAAVQNGARGIETNFKARLTNGQSLPAEAKTYWDTFTPAVDEPANSTLNQFLTRSAEAESLQALVDKNQGSDGQTLENVLLSREEYSFLQRMTAPNTTPQEYRFKVVEAAELKALGDKRQTVWEAYRPKTEARKSLENQLGEKDDQELINALPNLSPQLRQQYQDSPEFQLQPDQEPEPTENEDGETPEQRDPARGNRNGYEEWKKAVVAEAVKQKALDDESLKELKDAYETAQNEYNEQVVKDQGVVDNTAIYQAPTQTAEKLLNQHRDDFKNRFRRGQLTSVDFDLLTDQTAQEALLGTEAELTVRLVNDTRAEVERVLTDELSLANLTATTESQLESADKFLSYEAIVQRLAATRTAGETSQLLEVFNRLDKRNVPVDPRQILGSVALHYREKIMDNTSDQAIRRSKTYNQFLDNYTRQHHSITKSDRVEKLLQFSEVNADQQKKQLDQPYEHAYETVSSLFANSERAAILEGLNKILKTEISAESILNQIESQIGEEELIHNGSKGQIAGWKGIIVQALSGNVTAENDHPDHLQAVATDLLTKVEQMRAAQVAQAALREGVKQLQQTDEDNLAVSDRLELARRTHLVLLEVDSVQADFEAGLDNLRATLKRGEDPARAQADFLSEFDRRWQPGLNTLKDAVLAECDLHFPPPRNDFTKNLDTQLTSTLGGLGLAVDTLRRVKPEDLKPDDPGFELLKRTMSEVKKSFDLNSGDKAVEENEKINSTLQNAAVTHKFVRDELGVLQPEGRETARKNYTDKLASYERQVSDFQNSWEPAKKRLEKDLKKYTDEEFAAKHKMTPAQARKSVLLHNDQRLQDARWMVDYFGGKGESPYSGNPSQVFDAWLNDYERAETQPGALQFMNGFQQFADVLGKDKEDFSGEVEGLDKFIKDYDNNKPTLFFKKRYRLTLQWYSLRSIFQMIKQSAEHWNKKTERNRDRMTAELGGKIWGNGEIGQEFNREANKKEEERVGDYKDRMKNYDYKQLVAVIEGAKNIRKDKDRARAAVETLVEKGELSIDSLIFLNLLNRLAGANIFGPSDVASYAQDPDGLLRKVGDVYTDIWDRPTWIQLSEDFTSKYESAMKQHDGDVKQEVFTGGVDSYLIRSLVNWEKGTPDDDFERARFEQYIKSAIEQGVMNGYPMGGDRRLFYMIKAVTTKNPNTGEALLSLKAIKRFAELMGNIPYLDGLDDGDTWKKDGRVVPPETPGATLRSWNYEDIMCWAKYFDSIPVSGLSFADIKSGKGLAEPLKLAMRKWFNEVLVPTNDAQDRITKVPLDKIDHDDAGNLPLLIGPEKVKDSFNYNSGEVRQVTEKFQVNFMGSYSRNYEDMVNYLKMIEDNYKDAPGYRDFMQEQLRRFGQMLRSYFMVSHQMAGNWDFVSAVGSMTMSDKEWFTNDLQSTHDNIQDKIMELTGNSGINKFNLKERRNISKTSSNNEYHKLKESNFKDEEHYRAVGVIEDIFRGDYFADYSKLANMAGVSF